MTEVNESLTGGANSTDHSIKLVHDGHVKIYLGKISQPKKYRFAYRSLTGVPMCMDTDKFPLEQVYSQVGYLFVNGVKNTVNKYVNRLPRIEAFDQDNRRTHYVNLSKYFDDTTSVVIKCSPVKYMSPKMLHEIVLRISEEPIKKIESMYQHIVESINTNFEHTGVTTVNKWIEYICQNCPVDSITGLPFRYEEIINNDTFKSGKLTVEDIKNKLSICYDMRIDKQLTGKVKELGIVKAIEKYEDQNQMVVFYNNYNNRIKEVKQKMKEKGLQYYPVDVRKLVNKNPHLKDLDPTDIAIRLQWNDLNSLGIKWKITDFL